jgi:hypothetical protein
MKLRIASLAILCLALAAIPAWAGPDNGCRLPACGGYDNGPINGTTDAWTINFGYTVSDTFVAEGSLMSIEFGTWEFPGDTMLTVDWSVTTAENGGTTLGSGTASVNDRFISSNQFGYDIDLITLNTPVVSLTLGTTYWLNLQNAVIANGDPVFWDENSGVGCSGSGCPSSASESAIGTIPSEAFSINGGGPGTPEPSSILLFGSGILGLVGVLRRKLTL